ncbi:MAG: TolC family protein [Armatimonadetes bacterium]|nr:TolC family protein [Armatimonadota bacterium]
MTGKLLIRTATSALLVLLLGLPTLADNLTLRQAIETALQNNPSIAAEQLTADAAAEAVRGAKALKNPEMIVAPNVAGSGGSDTAAMISQPLELNGSRKARVRAASGEAAAADAEAQIVSRDIVLKVKQLYWETARTIQVVDLNENNVTYLNTLRDAVRRQVDVGRSPGSELIKTDVELARAQQELAQAQFELDSKKAAFNSLLNRPGKSDFTLADKLSFVNINPDAEQLLAAGLSNRPEIRSATAEIGNAQGLVDMARADYRPDVAIQARKESFDSGDSGIAVSVTLPVFDWGSSKSSIRQAKILASGRMLQLEAVRNSIKLDIEQAILSEQTTAKVVRQFEGGILDKTTQLAAMAQKGYEKGATSYLEVLEAQRTLQSIKADYISAIADHSSAVAQLEWATNVEIDAMSVGEVKK